VAEIILRFFIGGIVVAAFAVIGDVLRPKSFAGLFGAAPSVALASLGLTIARHGGTYAAVECRSMLAGAVALAIYSTLVCGLLMRGRLAPLSATLTAMLAWFAVSFGAWFLSVRSWPPWW
jgi:Protein of unknown function (DUF3147)